MLSEATGEAKERPPQSEGPVTQGSARSQPILTMGGQGWGYCMAGLAILTASSTLTFGGV